MIFVDPSARKKHRILIGQCKKIFINRQIVFLDQDNRAKLVLAPFFDTKCRSKLKQKFRNVIYIVHDKTSILSFSKDNGNLVSVEHVYKRF